MKSKLCFWASFIFVSLLFSSCNDNEDLISGSPEQLVSSFSEQFKVSPEQAVERLKSFVNEDISRTPVTLCVSDVKVLTKEKSFARTSDLGNIPDTLMYVINLADERGFAIMSADKRTEPIFALIDKGYYDLDEEKVTEKNQGFEMFLDLAKNYMVSKIQNNINSRALGDETEYGEGDDWILQKKTLPKMDYLWNQFHPYNMYTPLCDGVHAPTGCVATALGMVTAKLGNISSINGYPIGTFGRTTDELEQDASKADAVARFLREIGRNINTEYSRDVSVATVGNAENFLKIESGIKYVTGFRDFYSDIQVSNLYDCLRSKSGLAVVFGWKQGYNIGHCWVLDGIKVYLGTHENDGKELQLYHCNWGYGGNKDGYFLASIYASNSSLAFIEGKFTEYTPAGYDLSYNLIYCAVNNKRID